jgi:hypothetical protein
VQGMVVVVSWAMPADCERARTVLITPRPGP